MPKLIKNYSGNTGQLRKAYLALPKNTKKSPKEISNKDFNIKLGYAKKYFVDNDRPFGPGNLIENPIHSGMIKAGMTVDFEARLASYNVYDPYDAFKYIKIKYVDDRRKSEIELLKILKENSSYNKGEWFKIDRETAILLFE